MKFPDNNPPLMNNTDNGWTDCYYPADGGYNPLERLAYMRKRFWNVTGGNVLGRGFLPTQVTNTMYPENQIFTYGNVVHIIVNVVGSNNGYYDNKDKSCNTYINQVDPSCNQSNTEFHARDAAVNTLVMEGFQRAKDSNIMAVMLYFQGDLFNGPCGGPQTNPACKTTPSGCACCDITQPIQVSSGFINFWDTIVTGAQNFAGQVVMVHGDFHHFQIFPEPGGVKNLLSVMVPGNMDVGWIEADITASIGSIPTFSFQMYDNNPNYNYYANCPNNPDLKYFNVTDAFPPSR